MSMAIAHFAFGATMTTLVVTFLLPAIRYPRTVVLLGGVWAMLPDAHWVSPVAADRLHELHRSAAWTDLFWLHRTMDGLDTDSRAVGALLVLAFLVVTALAERRSFRAPERVRAAYEPYLSSDEA